MPNQWIAIHSHTTRANFKHCPNNNSITRHINTHQNTSTVDDITQPNCNRQLPAINIIHRAQQFFATIRNSQFAIRNSQFAISFSKSTIDQSQ